MPLLDRADSCLGRALLRALAVPLLMGGLFGTWHGVDQLWTAWSARKWPVVEGEIVRSRRNGSGFDVRYRYVVDGAAYESSRVHVGQFSGIESYARAIVARYSPGLNVVVFYDPDEPSSAVLQHRRPWTSAILTACGLALITSAWLCWTTKRHLSELMTQPH